MILALNTSQSIHELALLDGEKILAEKQWTNAKEDVEKLVPIVQELLDEAATNKEAITDLVAVKGPGSFTSVRVGVAFMNALAEGLRTKNKELKLHEIDTFELLKLKASTKDPVLPVLYAGALDVAIPGHTGPLAALLAKIPHDHAYKVLAELPETLQDELRSIVNEKQWHLLEAHEQLSLGEALAIHGLAACKSTKLVRPVYLKEANITVSRDPWKR